MFTSIGSGTSDLNYKMSKEELILSAKQGQTYLCDMIDFDPRVLNFP